MCTASFSPVHLGALRRSLVVRRRSEWTPSIHPEPFVRLWFQIQEQQTCEVLIDGPDLQKLVENLQQILPDMDDDRTEPGIVREYPQDDA